MTELERAAQQEMAERELDYGRYRDTVGDWQRERAEAENWLQSQQNLDWQQYQSMLDYYSQLAQQENAAYNEEMARREAIRQYEQNFKENQRQFDVGTASNEKIAAGNNSATLGAASIGANASMANAQLNAELARLQLAEEQRQFDANYGLSQQNADWNRNMDMLNYGLSRDASDLNRLNADRNYDLNMLNYGLDRDKTNAGINSDTRDYYMNIAASTIENGQIPSAEILAAAGITEADARALLAQPQASVTGSNAGSSKASGETDSGKKTYYYMPDGYYYDETGKKYKTPRDDGNIDVSMYYYTLGQAGANGVNNLVGGYFNNFGKK